MERLELKSNKIATLIATFINLLLVGGYLVEYIRVPEDKVRILSVIAVCIIAEVVIICGYKLLKQTPALKYLIFVSFMVVYAFAMFITTRLLNFTYALPMVVICCTYANLRFFYRVNAIVLLMTIVRLIWCVN